MPQKPRQIRERNQKQFERLDALILRRFKASNMSDAKWIKLLRAACPFAARVPRMNYKLVNSPEIQNAYTEQFEEQVEVDWFGEPVLYKEVEWMEFPYHYEVARGPGLAPLLHTQEIEALKTHLKSIAAFPLEETSTGLRVVAYVEI